MKTIKQILMERDGMTANEAERLIEECREDLMGRIACGDIIDSQDICMEYFGLEPDYLMELL